MLKKLFTKVKSRISAKARSRLAKRAKMEAYQRMAGDVYQRRIKAQKEADALRRAANGTTDQPRSILG